MIGRGIASAKYCSVVSFASDYANLTFKMIQTDEEDGVGGGGDGDDNETTDERKSESNTITCIQTFQGISM